MKIIQSASLLALMSLRCSGFQARRMMSTSSWFKTKPRAMSQNLQGMYDSLSSIQDVHASTKDPWSCRNVLQCVEHMGKIELGDLSLSGYPVKKTSCMNIAETPHFQIAVFLLPKDRTLPVHDHPGMTVLSKVVAGELSVASFTAESEKNTSFNNLNNLKSPLRVKLQEHSFKRPTDKPWIISPTVGNYHEFTARSDCVILDVLLPPYAYPERPCNYYRAQPEVTTPVTPTTPSPITTPTTTHQRHNTEDTTSSTSSYKNKEGTRSNRWVLTTISVDEAHRLYGLPFGVEYPGYVPSKQS